jgi:hypothetical protein
VQHAADLDAVLDRIAAFGEIGRRNARRDRLLGRPGARTARKISSGKRMRFSSEPP